MPARAELQTREAPFARGTLHFMHHQACFSESLVDAMQCGVDQLGAVTEGGKVVNVGCGADVLLVVENDPAPTVLGAAGERDPGAQHSVRSNQLAQVQCPTPAHW